MKRLISVLLICCMVMAMFPVSVFAIDIVASGYCGGDGDGTNLTWELDSEGVLTISGTGSMEDYGTFGGTSTAPWYDYLEMISAVVITEGVTTVGREAFAYYSNISSISFPNSLEEIGIYSFAYCTKITSLNLPDGLQKIHQHAFDNCSNLQNVTIPKSVASIASDVFEDCPKLKSAGPLEGKYNIEFGWETKIPSHAFSGCSYLEYVVIPSTIEKMGTECFTDCTKLLTAGPIDGDYNIEFGWAYKIPVGAFTGCPKLTSIYIPEGIDDVGDRALSECYSLIEINVDSKNNKFASVDGVLYSKDKTELIQYPSGKTGAFEVPQGVTTISSFAFGCTTQLNKCNKLTSIVFPESLTKIDCCAFQGCIAIERIDVPENVTDISYMAFNHCSNLLSAYFYGNAPSSFDMSIGGIFDDCSSKFTIYCIEGKSGWMDSEAYDAVNGTWNGYKLQVIKQTTPAAPDITYTNFGKLENCTYKTIPDSSTGMTKFVVDTVTIDDVLYNVAENSGMPIVTLPESGYLKEYYYIAYNLNENNEVSNATFLPGVECTLEGYNPTTNIIETDYYNHAIRPIGEDNTLPSGSFYVSDVTVADFPTDKIGSWVGDKVRVYCIGETIYKIIHIVSDSGVITNFDALSTPQIVYIDNVPLNIFYDNALIESIRQNTLKSVNYVRYDNTIVEISEKSVVVDWNMTTTPKYLGINLILEGLYKLGDGKIQIKNYKDGTVIAEIAADSEMIWCWYDDENGLENATQTTISIHFSYDFDFDTEYYIYSANDFIINKETETPLILNYFTDKDLSYWRTPIDTWRHTNYGDSIDKDIFTDMYGLIDGNVLYHRSGDLGQGGLCAGFVLSTWSFYLGKAGASEFYQNPSPVNIWDINLDSIMNDVGYDADEYIKRAFLLQYLPDIQEQKSQHMGNLTALYDVVRNSQNTNASYVYIALQSNSGGHAVWGYRVEDNDKYSVIYVYDCNHPTETRKIYLYGSYPNFTSFKYDEDNITFDNITYFTGLDYITGHLKNIDTLNLPYDIIFTDSTLLSVRSENGESAEYNGTDVSGSTGLLVPIQSIDLLTDEQDSALPIWMAENSVLTASNTSGEKQSLLYSGDFNVLEIDLNSSSDLVLDTLSNSDEIQMTLNVAETETTNIIYTMLIDGKLVDVIIEGVVDDGCYLIGREDSIVIGNIENPEITMDDGTTVICREIECDDNDSVEITIQKNDDSYDVEIEIAETPESTYTITFDANGGIVSPTYAITDNNGKLINLPTPTRSGYDFLGWYTIYNELVTLDTSFTSDTTIYAKWEQGPEQNDDFDWDYWYLIQMMIRNQEFTIEATAYEGGHITPDGESKVKYGNDLTYTITPDDGYEVVSVVVDGKDIGAVTEYTFKNVEKAHTISVVFAKLPWQNPFTDVFESDWFYDDVKFVNGEGLMLGVSTNEFKPEITLNRATIVTTLWRLAGSPIVEINTNFTDLPDDWYTAAMKWTISEGIILGYGDGTCRPMTEITHEQIIAILHRFMVSRGYEDKPITLSMQFIHSDWAENNVLWAITNNLFDGFGSDVSDLTKTANRAEIAAYLHRLCALTDKE